MMFTDNFYQCILTVNMYRTDYDMELFTLSNCLSINEEESRIASQSKLQR